MTNAGDSCNADSLERKSMSVANEESAVAPVAPVLARPTLRGHVSIARIDHWFKNVFVFPGVVAAIGIDPTHVAKGLFFWLVIGLASVCLVASSNYVINEVLDAPSDRSHPVKHARPVPSGQVSLPLAYVQWIALMLAGVALGFAVSVPYGITMLALWIMGCLYNIPPIRSK